MFDILYDVKFSQACLLNEQQLADLVFIITSKLTLLITDDSWLDLNLP